jgi:hypothetical protein
MQPVAIVELDEGADVPAGITEVAVFSCVDLLLFGPS